MPGFTLGAGSRKRLQGVHPDLVRVVERAIEVSRQDFTVLCGVRTLAEQRELYAQGRTKPGRKVTWTLNSRHIPQDDGFGHAVDLVPFPLDWNNAEAFEAIMVAMMRASRELKIPIRWGKNWDMDDKPGEAGETDSPHFELA